MTSIQKTIGIITVVLVLFQLKGAAQDVYTIDADLTEMTGNASVASNLTVGQLTLNGESITNWTETQNLTFNNGVIYQTDFSSNPFTEACWIKNDYVWWMTNYVIFRAMTTHSSQTGKLFYVSGTQMPFVPYEMQFSFSNSVGYNGFELKIMDGERIVKIKQLGGAGEYQLKWTGSWNRIEFNGRPGPSDVDISLNMFSLTRKNYEYQQNFLHVEESYIKNLAADALLAGQISTTNIITRPGENFECNIPSPGSDFVLQSGYGGYCWGNGSASKGGDIFLKTGKGGNAQYSAISAGDGGNLMVELGNGGNGDMGSGGTRNGAGGNFIVKPGLSGTGYTNTQDGAIYLLGPAYFGSRTDSNEASVVAGVLTANGAGLYIPPQGDLEMGSYTNGVQL